MWKVIQLLSLITLAVLKRLKSKSSCCPVICPDIILSSGFLDIILSQANKILVLSPIRKKSGPIWMTVKERSSSLSISSPDRREINQNAHSPSHHPMHRLLMNIYITSPGATYFHFPPSDRAY